METSSVVARDRRSTGYTPSVFSFVAADAIGKGRGSERDFSRFESLWSEVEQKQIYEAFQAGLPLEWLPPYAPDSRLIPLPTSDGESTELANRPPLFSGFARDLVLLLRAARMLASCLRTKSAADVDHLIRTGLDSELQPAPQRH